MRKTFEVRDVIHGFITLNEWEREIINHPVFQRLRRIKQLSLTDMVYPGACHTRFEHSIGVMHLASLMFDSIKARRKDFLSANLEFGDSGFERDRVLIRLAALLHDLGHSPFSHAGEDLMPLLPEDHSEYKAGESKRYAHEDYSIAIIKTFFKDIIENHVYNEEYNIKVEEVCMLLGDDVSHKKRSLLWKNIISSQLDADRSDYLLRDSKHIGVEYGVYDLSRLLNTLSVAYDNEQSGYVLAVEDGGWHVAESLVIARYQMFTQVYFQKTRRIYDHHISKAMKSILQKYEKDNGVFPSPETKVNLENYIKYDDWYINGLIKEGMGGEHGEIILNRGHYRCVFETSEVPDLAELDKLQRIKEKYKDYIVFVDDAGRGKPWYKVDQDDLMILINANKEDEKLVPLSQRSSIIAAIKPNRQFRLYVEKENKKIKYEISKEKG